LVLSGWALILHDRRPVIDESTLKGIARPHDVTHLTGLTIEWTAPRYRDCPARVTWEIRDSAGQVQRDLGESYQFSRTTGYDRWFSKRNISPKWPLGPATYYSTIEYLCGWTRFFVPFEIKSPPIEFHIHEAPK
jgi:hypothetical protein